ncbi:MAG: guanylate kinase [Lachnospiraceae bacterium]|nr:guanylate kinase [Lachnospiraceae bacterium]
MEDKSILIVISGFSGAGKGTLVKRLISDYDNYALSVSMTTRAPRPGEVEGKDYFYVTKEAFEERIRDNGLIEYAQYVGNYYGTPRDYVEEQLAKGRDVILEIEIQGALKIREQYKDALLLFVMPPSAAELKNRLLKRATETEEAIRNRLRRAAEESEGIDEYEYIVINDDLDACVRELHSLIRAAHYAAKRNEGFISRIKSELETYR